LESGDQGQWNFFVARFWLDALAMAIGPLAFLVSASMTLWNR